MTTTAEHIAETLRLCEEELNSRSSASQAGFYAHARAMLPHYAKALEHVLSCLTTSEKWELNMTAEVESILNGDD